MYRCSDQLAECDASDCRPWRSCVDRFIAQSKGQVLSSLDESIVKAREQESEANVRHVLVIDSTVRDTDLIRMLFLCTSILLSILLNSPDTQQASKEYLTRQFKDCEGNLRDLLSSRTSS